MTTHTAQSSKTFHTHHDQLESLYLNREPLGVSAEIKHASTWLQSYPSNLKPIYARSRVLLKSGNFLAARSILIHTLRVCERDTGALWTVTHLARMLFQHNKSAQLLWALDFAKTIREQADPKSVASSSAMLDAIAALWYLRVGRLNADEALTQLRAALSRIRGHDQSQNALHCLQVLHLIFSTPSLKDYPSLIHANDYRLIDYVHKLVDLPRPAQHLLLACIQLRLAHPCVPTPSFLSSLFSHLEKAPIWPTVEWTPRSLGHACSIVLWALANPAVVPGANTQLLQPFLRVTLKVFQTQHLVMNYSEYDQSQIQDMTEFYIYKGLNLGPNNPAFYEARTQTLRPMIKALSQEVSENLPHGLIGLKSLLLANTSVLDNDLTIQTALADVDQALAHIKTKRFRQWCCVLHNYVEYQHRNAGSEIVEESVTQLLAHPEISRADPSILGRLARICIDKGLFSQGLELKLRELSIFKQSPLTSSELAAHTLLIGYAMTGQLTQATNQCSRIESLSNQPYLVESLTRVLKAPGQSAAVIDHVQSLLEQLPASGQFGDLRLKDKGPQVVADVLKRMSNDENRFLLEPKFWLDQHDLAHSVEAFTELFSQSHAKTQFILNSITDNARTLENPLKAEVLRRIVWLAIDRVRESSDSSSVSQIQNVLVRLRFHRLFFGNPPRRLTAIAGMKYIQGLLNDPLKPLPEHFDLIVSEVSTLWHDLSEMDWGALQHVFSRSLTYNEAHPALNRTHELRALFNFANAEIKKPRSQKKKAPKKGASESPQ